MKADRINPPAHGRTATRAIWALAAMVLAAAGTASAQHDGTSPQAGRDSGQEATQMAWIQYMSAELRRIHVELLEERRDMQQAKMQDLEHDLETIRAQLQQIQDEQRGQTQQAADIEAQLTQPSLGKSEREELEAQRSDLLAASPSRFGAAQNALAQQEARARERLAAQEQRVNALDRQIAELSAASQ